MSKSNLEHYKKELEKIFNEGLLSPSDVFDKVKTNCDSNIRSCCWTTYTRDILEWMSQPYKESILNDTEKEYLADVIRPFREKVNTISKFHSWDDSSQYIYIETEIPLPVPLHIFKRKLRQAVSVREPVAVKAPTTTLLAAHKLNISALVAAHLPRTVTLTAAVFSPLPSSILLRINILRRTTKLCIGAYEPVLAECYG